MNKRLFQKKIIAAALAVLLVCVGCAGQGSAINKESMLLPSPAVKHLRFSIYEQADSEVRELAVRFAQDVERLSKGTVLVEIVVGPLGAKTMPDSDIDLALLRNIQIAQVDPLFSMFSLPFMYDDYKHMSRALNDGQIIDVLTQRLAEGGLEPLAALYSGNSWIVSIDRDLRNPSDFKDLAIAMRTDNADKLAAFEMLGAKVLPYTQTSVAGLLGAPGEMPPKQEEEGSVTVTIEAVEATLEQALNIKLSAQTLYLIDASHAIVPVWLVADTDSLAQLSSFERAALNEAVAGFHAAYEQHQVALDAARINELTAYGFTHTISERGTLSAVLYDSERYTLPAYFDRKLYRTIQTFA